MSPVGHVTDDPTVFVNQSFSLANVAGFTVPNPGPGQTTHVIYSINWNDGTSESHQLSLAGDSSGLPLVHALSNAHTFHSIPADPNTFYSVNISVFLCDASWNPQPQAYSSQSIPYFVVAAPPLESSITTTTSNPVDARSVTFNVQFTAPVTNVSDADFVVAGDGVSGTIYSVTPGTRDASGYCSTCTVTVNNISFTNAADRGTLGLDLIDDNTIVDANGDPLGGSALGDGAVTGPAYTIDNHLYFDNSVAQGSWNANNQSWRIGSPTGPWTVWIPNSDAIIPQSTTTITIPFGYTVAASSLTFLGTGDTVSGGILNFGRTGGTIDVEGGPANVSSAIVGANLAKTGPASLVLTGTNNVAAMEVDQGPVQVATAAPLGSGPLTINGGVLEATQSFTLVQPVFIGTSRSTVQVDAGKTLIVAGPLSGNGTFAVTGSGTTKITGSASSLTGPVNVANSTLDLQTPLTGSLSVSGSGHVTGSSTPLTATISGPSGGLGNATLNFTASATDSIAATPSNLLYTWRVLDSTNTQVATGSGTSSSIAIPPLNSNGAYTLSLVATDSDATSVAVTRPLIVDSAPTVVTPAAAADTSVQDSSTMLSVLGGDGISESDLTYTWSFTKLTGADDPTFFVNGSNAAKNTEVSFTSPGTYTFTATITNPLGQSVTSTTATVSVTRSLSSIAIGESSLTTPPSQSQFAVPASQSQQFTATAFDQFGVALATQPSFTWYLAGGSGTLSSSGLYTASATATTATLVVTPTSGIASGIAKVNVSSTTASITAQPTAVPAIVDGTTTNLSALGADSNGEADLIYSWAATSAPTGASAPVFSINGTNAAKFTTVTFSKAGSYQFRVTATDSQGSSSTSNIVNVTVNQDLDAIQVTPDSPTIAVNAQQQFTATAVNQFGNSLSSQPQFTWRASDGSISNNAVNPIQFSAPVAAETITVTASSGSMSGSTAVSVSEVPTAMFALSNSGAADEGDTATVSFAVAAGLNLPDLTAAFTYSFDFGNTGTFEVAGSSSPTVTVPAEYLADTVTSLTVRGRVTDTHGNSTDYTTTIPMVNVAPTIAAIGKQTVAAGIPLQIAGSFSDPGFSANPAMRETYNYVINFGDGSPLTTGTAFIDTAGSAGIPSLGSFGGSHIYTHEGQFTASVLLTDSQGEQDFQTFVVQVTHAQGTFSISGDNIATVGTPYVLNLTAAGNGTDSLQNWTIDWGDGTVPQQLPSGLTQVEHIYNDPGPAIISVASTDTQTTQIAGTIQVQVSQTSNAISGSDIAYVGVDYTLNLTVGTGQATPLYWMINWGDGSDEQQVSGGSQQVSHTYTQAVSTAILATSTTSGLTQDAGTFDVEVSSTTHTPPSPLPTSPMTYALTGLNVSAISSPAAGPTQYEITGSVVNSYGVPVSDALVELDTNGDGSADATTRTDESGNFTYAVTPNSYSQQTVKAQVLEWNAGASMYLSGPWVSKTYTPTIAATIDDIELMNATRPTGASPFTADPTLWGVVNAAGLNYTNCLITFEVGSDLSTLDPNTLQSTPVSAGGQFSYALQGLVSSPNPITVQASVTWTDPATGLQVQGTPTSLTFIYYVPPAPPSLASLGLADGTDPSGVISGTSPTIAGALDPDSPVLSGVTVQLSQSSDFSGAVPAYTDGAGHFSYQPSGLTSSTAPVTIYARSVVQDAVQLTPIYGAVRTFTFTSYQPQTAPTITSFSVITASDPTLAGQVNTSVSNYSNAVIQFAMTDSDAVIGSASVNSSGAFSFLPTTLSPSATPVTIRARSSLYDGTTNSYQYSAWVSKTFTFVRAAYVIPTVTLLEVSHPSGQTTGGGAPIVLRPDY